ncbi:MAG: hypothetical protein IJ354_04515 [Clostridia bacterium]|nr:hypothetical protein [Clostridia bacterium]
MMRYSRSRSYNVGSRSDRLKPILVIVLVLLAAFLIFKATGVGGINEGNFEVQRNSKLRSEVQAAQNCVNSLSRLGASSTSSMLGRIRQHVHGMEVINDLNVGMYGEVGRLYPQMVFDNVYSIIEEYDAKLTSGQKVSDTLTSLSAAVTELGIMTTTLLDGMEQN